MSPKAISLSKELTCTKIPDITFLIYKKLLAIKQVTI